MPRPVHFEIHAGDPGRARGFYSAVFGWTFQQWADNPYWLIDTGEGPGINGGLLPRSGPEPAADAPIGAFPVTMQVDDLDTVLAAVADHGGSVVVAKNALPGMGWLAYCKDTESNIFGLMQADPAAS